MITIKDFSIYTVTTNLTNNCSKTRMRTASTQIVQTPASKEFSANLYLNTNGEKFLESNFSEFNLPSDTVLINVFLSEFYFPDEFNYPLPNIQIYSQISPIKLNIDYLTLLWINMLYLALSTEIIPLVNELHAKATNGSTTSTTNQLFDACVECILPKISLKLYNSGYYNSNIPKFISIFCSSLKFTNLCIDQESDLKNLCKRIYNEKNLCMNFDRWPFEPTDLAMVPNCLLDICKEMQESSFEKISEKIVSPKHGLLISNLSKKEFKTSKISSAELFLLKIDNLWIETSLNEPKVQDSTNNENTMVLPVSFNLWLLNTNGYLSNKKPQVSFEINKINKNLNLRYKETMFSESSRSFYVDNPNLLLSKTKQSCKSNHRRRKSFNDAIQHPTSNRGNIQNAKYFNSKLNAIIDLKNIEVKISHYQLLFLLRLLDEFSFFQKKIEEDALKIVLSLNKELKMSLLSLSAVIFVDKLELKLLISDKRKFKLKTKSNSLGRFFFT